MSEKNDEYIQSLRKDFFEEAFDMIERMEEHILVLEKDIANEDAVKEIFRAVHTLKGSAGAVELVPIAAYAHAFEDLLDLARENKITVDKETVDVLLNGIDILKEMVTVSFEEKEITRAIDKDVAVLEAFKNQRMSGEVKAPQEKAQHVDLTLSAAEHTHLTELTNGGLTAYYVRVEFLSDSPMKTVGGVQVYVGLKESGTLVASNPPLKELETDAFYPVVNYLLCSAMSPEEIQEHVSIDEVTKNIAVTPYQVPATVQEGKEDRKDSKRQSNFLRVENERIDEMLNQVGELVINKSSYQRYDDGFISSLEELNGQHLKLKVYFRDTITELLKKLEPVIDKRALKEMKNALLLRMNGMFKDTGGTTAKLKTIIDRFRTSYQMLTRVTNELQETVMKIRMVPIAQIFNRFPRLVRDLSRDLGKEIELVIVGEQTELDKSVIELLVDPLIHLVRNSIDHGIETADERERSGKSRAGTIRLAASHEGNFIVITVTDDGKGIDLERVRKSAVNAGFVAEDARLTEKETIDLIFEAGLSTADKVTSLSGRGVGMDVVKKSIENINGGISVETARGVGSTFTLRIPLTLAIIEALIVETNGEFYAIPVNSIVETMRITRADIATLEGIDVICLRDEYISALSLKDLFNLNRKGSKDVDVMYAVVITFADKKVALVVDNLLGEQDIVIKALRDRISNARGVAGATILGDGTISFILDVQMLADIGAKKVLASRALDKAHTITNTAGSVKSLS
ncbi:MAG: chemotaxis protein CheA [Spirochaetes bacterium]|nr:chemotaxis protein CheA [Spirochaetota bacterium]